MMRVPPAGTRHTRVSLARLPLLAIWVAVLWDFAEPQVVYAQTGTLTEQDSMRLVLEAFDLLLDNTATRAIPNPIWLKSDTAHGATTRNHLSARQAEAILQAHPRVRVISEAENVYLCPPGREVRMPISGCPIRDSGVIAALRMGQRSAELLIIEATMIKSVSSGRITYAETLGIAFRWVKDGWQYGGIVYRRET